MAPDGHPTDRDLIRLRQEVRRLNDRPALPFAALRDQLASVLSPMLTIHEQIAQASRSYGGALSQVTGIMEAHSALQQLTQQARDVGRPLAGLDRIQPSWFNMVSRATAMQQLPMLASLNLASSIGQLTLAESVWGRLNFEALQRSLRVSPDIVSNFRDAVGDAMAKYDAFVTSLATYEVVLDFPPFVMPGASRELLATAVAADTLRLPELDDAEIEAIDLQIVEQIEHDCSDCRDLLQAVDEELLRPYEGAHRALHSSDNVDRARHCLSSLRELWDHLMRRIAPNEEVLKWADPSDGTMVHNGRPTRRARVLYVCRSINEGPLAEFVSADTNALLKFHDVFQRLHELDLNVPDSQLRALVARSDSNIEYLVRIVRGS